MSSEQAKITITFYIGSSDKPDDKLKKSYILKKWGHEWALRVLLDEIAKELNYISGYGIWSIQTQSEELNFTVDYSNQFRPCRQDTHLDFWHILRFEVGRYTGWRGGFVRVEIPRVSLIEGNNLFTIKRVTVGSRKKKIRDYGTLYHLYYDRTDPIFISFLQKLKEDIFTPDVKKKWQRTAADNISISWWELSQTQTSQHRWESERKRQELEEKKRKKLEKEGIVYKDKRKKQKAYQVYIVQVNDESMPGVYKIGISNAPGKRLQALSTSNPFALGILHQFIRLM